MRFNSKSKFNIFYPLTLFAILFVVTSCESGTTTFTYGNNNEAAVKLETLNGIEGVAVYYDKVPQSLVVPSKIMGYDVLRISVEGASGIEKLNYVFLPETALVVDSFFKAISLKEIYLSKNLVICPRFESCTSLTKIEIPDSVQVLQLYSFAECSSLETITFGKSLHTLDDFCFMNCKTLTELSFENTSVSNLGSGVFSGCTALTSIDFGNAMTEFEKNQMSGLSSLKSVTLGNNVKKVDLSSFELNKNLATVICKTENPPEIDKSSFAISKRKNGETEIEYYNATLYVPENSTTAYQNHEIWKMFKEIKSIGTLENENSQ